MSEPLSALFLIADDGEFRFARFYSVYEGVQVRAARKSAHCLWCAGHVPVGLSKRGRDTESDANALNFSQRIFHPHFHLKSKGMIPSSYFFSRQTGLSAESDSPVFVQSAEAAGLFAGHLLFLLHDHFLDHLAADASGLCGSQVAVVAVL